VTTPAMTTIALGRCFGRGERQGSKPEDHDYCLYMCHVKTLLASRTTQECKIHKRRSTTMLETSLIRHEPQVNRLGPDRTA
jgi:hypothetical protein